MEQADILRSALISVVSPANIAHNRYELEALTNYGNVLIERQHDFVSIRLTKGDMYEFIREVLPLVDEEEGFSAEFIVDRDTDDQIIKTSRNKLLLALV